MTTQLHPAPTPVGKFSAALQIMRFDRPIGTYLLAAPTLWALLLANNGTPPLRLLLVFLLGVVVMRAAGCTANDLADRKLDGFVERTRGRPLVTGALSVREAVLLLIGLLAVAFALVLSTNLLAVALSLVGLGLAMVYPFMKRVTHLPQVVLGAAFSWSIPIAFAASIGAVPPESWWLFAANLLWTVVYDTQYAMVDREDDLSVGIRSTAILFGSADIRVIALLQLLCIAAFLAVGARFDLNWPWYLAIGVVALMFLRHLWITRHRDRNACFRAFNEAKWVGAVVLAGLLGHFALGGV